MAAISGVGVGVGEGEGVWVGVGWGVELRGSSLGGAHIDLFVHFYRAKPVIHYSVWVELLIHSQIPMVKPLKFGNE